MIIAIEGLDGAGKNTLTTRLVARLTGVGRSVATLAYPRYEARPLGPALRGLLTGDAGLAAVAAQPRATAMMFALDRAASRPELDALLAEHDVVLLDRYVASNAAYGAARLAEPERAAFQSWIADLELGSLALPVPDLQVLLRIEVDRARADASARADGDPGRPRDTFEADDGLQARCAHMYEDLAARSWLSPWLVVDRETGVDAVDGWLTAASAH
ncbi:Thymidylate kinase [Frankia canadensis]|uniref:Thymidylate kinase n=1 Tax=Frankia canadensis TaxID=1836972 RepID=A0A2I2KT40_9ACTN|nr:dTMP kinase [Frankia canadensis]SNQ48838.1 Thymidylate kinase [Frankia canadensis]SOU56128.1 Thymidylate kinase [Frankia canadensis]